MKETGDFLVVGWLLGCETQHPEAFVGFPSYAGCGFLALAELGTFKTLLKLGIWVKHQQ
ncbi:hypothetical protein H6F61_14510 [Cyanobacteria bacterium FACHB-472]|nr:hypothetical protein [Cyanobacteria bacterium FACHB-472]